jgi:hypothetical protein
MVEPYIKLNKSARNLWYRQNIVSYADSSLNNKHLSFIILMAGSPRSKDDRLYSW